MGPGRRPYPAKLPWYVDSMAQARQGMDAEAMRAFCPAGPTRSASCAPSGCIPDERAIIQSFDDFHNDDIHADLPLLDAAVLLITAERGDVVLDADVEEIQRLAPGTRHHRVPAAGHMIPWDNEEGFYAAFGDFLARAGAA